MQAIVNMLELILVDTYNRYRLVKDFQKGVFNTTINDSEENLKIYTELADILDYYEPEEAARIWDSSYYGDDRLIVEISQALKKLKR